MDILFACSEVTPFARTGGLGDVCAALPVALSNLGHSVTVIMPAYRCVFQGSEPVEPTDVRFTVPVGDKEVEAVMWKGTLPHSNVPIYFVQQDMYFGRDALYSEYGEDYGDNCERFVFLSRAVMEAIDVLKLHVDILHSNDWQTGLVPAYQKLIYRAKPKSATPAAVGKIVDEKKETPGVSLGKATSCYQNIATVHSIHNLAYQGIFWHWDMLLTGIGWEHFTFDQMEFYGKLNLMKTGIMFADGITTVSPRYALEIQSQTFGCGMETVLQYRSPMLRGILNGVCTKQWNPATDPHIAAQYDEKTVFENKPICKRDLQNKLGLAEKPETPLFGVVSRFAHQKGIDLVAEVIPLWVEKHGVQFCILGKGDYGLEGRLLDLASRYPENVAVLIEFSDEWAHRIEAGCDIFLMPSRYEPCGLNQMYSQMYGTVPLVHDTGGLADTVVDLNEETQENNTATGFSFFADTVHDLNTTMWRTLNVYWNQRDIWQQLMLSGMQRDWSWQKSAEQYVRFYEKLRKNRSEQPSLSKKEDDSAIIVNPDRVKQTEPHVQR